MVQPAVSATARAAAFQAAPVEAPKRDSPAPTTVSPQNKIELAMKALHDGLNAGHTESPGTELAQATVARGKISDTIKQFGLDLSAATVPQPVVRRKPAAGTAAAPVADVASASSKCEVCGKTVYIMEQVEAGGVKYHKRRVVSAARAVLTALAAASAAPCATSRSRARATRQLRARCSASRTTCRSSSSQFGPAAMAHISPAQGNYEEGFGGVPRKHEFERPEYKAASPTPVREVVKATPPNFSFASTNPVPVVRGAAAVLSCCVVMCSAGAAKARAVFENAEAPADAAPTRSAPVTVSASASSGACTRFRPHQWKQNKYGAVLSRCRPHRRRCLDCGKDESEHTSSSPAPVPVAKPEPKDPVATVPMSDRKAAFEFKGWGSA